MQQHSEQRVSLRDHPLSQILASEQQILLRTDQKAYTLLSVLGVFMVFFLVHYTKIPVNLFILVLLVLYFASAMLTIYYLVRTLIPRIAGELNPAFWAGIARYPSWEAYHEEMSQIAADPARSERLIARQVYSLGSINARKNRFLRSGTVAFIAALTSELLIIVVTFVRVGLALLG